MNFQTALNNFIHPDDQDAFARSQGWEDAAQMCYYEDLAMAEEDRQREEAAQAKLHELDKVDSREVYGDDGDRIEWSMAIYCDDLAGVY